MNDLLLLSNVSKAFGNLKAVDRVTMAVPEGQIIGLIGPNGSGKSTLLNLIASTTPTDDGRITFDGHNITHLSPDAVFQRGLIRSFQDPSLFFRMTVLDNALLPIKAQRGESPWLAPFHGTWAEEEEDHADDAYRALSTLELKDHLTELASDLSGGQMKLLELGRSLMGEPRLLLLDEPTAGVAPALAYRIFEQIERMRVELGLTFLIVEHRLEMLFDFVDSLYVMHLGRIIAEGTPAQIEVNETVREVYFGA